MAKVGGSRGAHGRPSRSGRDAAGKRPAKAGADKPRREEARRRQGRRQAAARCRFPTRAPADPWPVRPRRDSRCHARQVDRRVARAPSGRRDRAAADRGRRAARRPCSRASSTPRWCACRSTRRACTSSRCTTRCRSSSPPRTRISWRWTSSISPISRARSIVVAAGRCARAGGPRRGRGILRRRRDDTEEAIAIVASGVGVVIVPMSLARLHHRKDADYRPLRDGPASTVALAWPADGTIAGGRGVRRHRARTHGELVALTPDGGRGMSPTWVPATSPVAPALETA